MVRDFRRRFGIPDERKPLPPEEKPFSLRRLTRHPTNQSQDFGISLNGVGASTDEWTYLDLEFETLNAAWLAASILTKLLPAESTPWLFPEEQEPVIEVMERHADGSTTLCPFNTDSLDRSVTAWIEALLAAKKAVDEAAQPLTDEEFDF
ncbi:hypothetical protein [Altericroceibacterium xinjiangense]|uniref:hypothetical protein n=1 Tax=Altericroceibacterium xinjiangense TaxID=762261 RepID=UPI000F7ECD1D|nr:hypothetical protein [Altericroceibacterium xinjiangense]